MKTRDELLAMADECVRGIEHDVSRGVVDYNAIAGTSQYAQACVMLAKEMREGVTVVPLVVAIDSSVPFADLDWVAERLKERSEAKEGDK